MQILQQLRAAIPPPLPPAASSPPPPASSSLPLFSLFLSLKPLYRDLQLHVEQRKAELYASQRQSVEPLNIEAASWQYEAEHFRREIDRQRAFRSQQPEVELVSEDEYRAQHPEAPDDPHLLRVAMLEDELRQRKALLQRLEALQQRRAELQRANAAKREHLSSLLQQLTTVHDAAVPLYSSFFPSAAQLVFHPPSPRLHSLPLPLYLLHYTVAAYIGAFVQDDSVRLSIEEESEEEKSSRAKKGKAADALGLYSVHPLSLRVVLVSPSCTLSMRFSYLETLRLVAVRPAVSNAAEPSSASDYDGLLAELYPGDDGLALSTLHLSPLSPALQQQLSSSSPLPASVGSVYHWCQPLCGLHYQTPTPAAPQPAFAEVLLTVQQRMQHRLQLMQQLLQLGLVACGAPATLSSAAKLTSPYTVWYGKELRHGQWLLEVRAGVGVDYPARPPLYALRCVREGDGAVDERQIAVLESQINTEDAGADVTVLSRQLRSIEERWIAGLQQS